MRVVRVGGVCQTVFCFVFFGQSGGHARDNKGPVHAAACPAAGQPDAALQDEYKNYSLAAQTSAN